MRRTRSLAPAIALGLTLVIGACGGRPPPPKRGVMESDVGGWKFRRYQQVLDVEVWVPKNKGVAYTASYARGDAEKRGHLDQTDIANAFVTRYQHDRGVLRALVKFARRLAQESGYAVEVTRLGGTRVIEVKGHGEAWAVWAAPKHVVKVGGRGIDEVPGSLVRAYARRYPSRLKPGVLDGPLPPGEDEPLLKDDDDSATDPDQPAPDWDKYKKQKK